MNNNDYDNVNIPRLSFRYMGEVDSLSNIPIDKLCVGDVYTYKASEYIYLGKESDEEWMKMSYSDALDQLYL